MNDKEIEDWNKKIKALEGISINNTTIKEGTRKIADASRPCFDPAHNPPSHCVFEPGTYEHVCPACGHITIFSVPAIYL